MELDVAFKAWTKHSESVDAKLKKLLGGKPLHKPVAGAVQIGAVAPATALITIETRPAAGRVWNVRSVALLGADAHTPPVATSYNTSGTAAAPAANTNISGGVNPIAGSYIVNWVVGLAGTVAIAVDVNNFKLVYGPATIVSPSINPGAVGQWPQPAFPLVASGGQSLHVNSIAAASAGTQYNAGLVVTPAFGPGTLPQVIADIYGGMLVASPTGAPAQEVLTDVIVSNAVIPSVNYVPNKAVWLHEMETVYAIITNPPANSQFVLSARIDDYPVDAVEAMAV